MMLRQQLVAGLPPDGVLEPERRGRPEDGGERQEQGAEAAFGGVMHGRMTEQ
jgi:hypothetical protein